MKLPLITRFIGVFALFMVTTAASAQDNGFKELPEITISKDMPQISDRVWNSFQEYFKGASKIRWYEINKNYLAKFIMNEQDNQAAFTKKGNLIYHISYGAENNLPEDVRKIVKESYYSQNITSVIKVNQDDKIVWVVNLEDDNNLYLVRVTDGALDEIEKYNRAG